MVHVFRIRCQHSYWDREGFAMGVRPSVLNMAGRGHVNDTFTQELTGHSCLLLLTSGAGSRKWEDLPLNTEGRVTLSHVLILRGRRTTCRSPFSPSLRSNRGH